MTAQAAALGEAVETAAAREPPAASRRARLRDLPGALDPRRIGLYPAVRYRRPGFRYTPFHQDRRIAWEEGRWLDDGSPVLVPVGLVRYDERDRLCQATSNGLAAGRSCEDAIRAALLELLERDAFLAHWLARRPATRLDGDGLLLLQAAIDVPVVAQVRLGDGRTAPAVAVGAACRPDPADAAAHARGEAAAVAQVLANALRLREPVPPAGALSTPLDHGLLRLRSGQLAMRFLLNGQLANGRGQLAKRLDEVPHGPATLGDLIDALARAGLRAAAVELQAPHGWHVVRVLVPGLQPLWFGTHLRRSLTQRIRALAGGRPNPAPHPLA